MFDQSSPWNSISDFERDLIFFFTSKGLQTEPVKTIGSDERIMYLDKAPIQPPPLNSKPMTFKKPTGIK